jgi:hypothetical protein
MFMRGLQGLDARCKFLIPDARFLISATKLVRCLFNRTGVVAHPCSSYLALGAEFQSSTNESRYVEALIMCAAALIKVNANTS